MKPHRLLLDSLLLALCYLIVGRLSLLLAIPPGYAVAFWPAAGIALVALLAGGERLWGGVFLGSFLVNLGSFWDAADISSIALSLLIPFAIGLGAALQAVVSARLVRRHVRFPTALLRPAEIVHLFFLGGIVGSLVSPTCGMMVLWLLGLAPPENILFNWTTWWVGDAIGVLVIAPIALLWLAPAGSVSTRRRWTVTLPIVGIAACAVVINVRASSMEANRLDAEFARETEDISHRIQSHFEGYIESLYAVESLFIGSHNVEAGEFQAVVGKLLARNPGMQAISWNKHVLDSERNSFEAEIRKQGARDFRITDAGFDRSPVPAARRSEYVAVTYIEPIRGNESAVGLNILDEPSRRETIMKARDEGRPMATPRITLIQDTSCRPSFLVFLPLYRRGAASTTIEDRRRNIDGYVVGVFKVHDMTQAALHDVDDHTINICLMDEISRGPDACFFERIAGIAARGEPAGSIRFDMAGRTWEFRFQKTQKYLAEHRSMVPWSVLVSGLMATALFGAFILVMTGRAAETEESEIRYRGLFEETPIAILEKDFSALQEYLSEIRARGHSNIPEFLASHPGEVSRCAALARIVDANRAAIVLYGVRTKEELIGPLDRTLRNPEAEFLDELLAIVMQVETFEVDKNLIVLSGEIRRVHMRWSMIPAAPRDFDHVIVSIIDITEREHAAESLRSKSEQLAAVSRITTAFLEEGDWEAASSRILASSLSQTGSDFGFVGIVSDDGLLRIRSELEPIELLHYESCFRRIVSTESAVIENDQGSPDQEGSNQPRSFLGVPILRGGSVIGMIGVANRPKGFSRAESEKIEILAKTAGLLYDLSRRRIREQSLEQHMKHAQRLEAIGLLASGVAHEINNPLMYMIQNIESILLESADGEPGRVSGALERAEIRARARDAFEGAERVRDIVKGLKTFARDADDVSGPTDVARAIENALKIVRNEIRFRARVVKDFGRVSPVMADEGRLSQVFLNMLVNAAHAIPAGDPEHNEIRILVSQDDGEARIEIRDTGRGMPQEVLDRVFDPFFTTKPVGEGTGLGLSICYNMIASFGGRIDVESEVGSGTRFIVHLPIAETSIASVPVPAAGTASALATRRGRILVVDDEMQIRNVIGRILRRDHDVVAAGDGSEALDLLAGDDRFDVILCDLMMPHLTGMELHESLLQRQPALAERMIFMTGGAFTSDARTFMEATDRPCLEKPFTANAVFIAINGIIEENTARASLVEA